MPDPVHLQLFPSSNNCLAWSADGELAVSAGEYVHILTPLSQPAAQTQGQQDRPKGQWHISRFRANVFTSTEWPTLHPQDRSAFSIGAEQSLSTVAGLAWSPPGLARHRRCVLGVLTSNLVLAFYECVGGPHQGKWARVAVVNPALGFPQTDMSEGMMLRKSMVRSFAWCPPLKVPAEGEREGEGEGGASRWGVQVLEVTNDDNDVVFLRVQPSPLSFEVLAVYSLYGDGSSLHGDGDDGDSGSLLSSAMKNRVKSLSVACGPWVPRDEQPGVYAATSNLAVAYGKTLKTINLDVELTRQDGYKAVATCEENEAISKHVQDCAVTGPFEWIHTNDGLLLAAGAFTELVTISIPTSAYLGKRTKSKTQIRKWPFYEGNSRHWEPISGIASDREGAVYLSTNGGYGAKFLSSDADTDADPLSQPPWKDSFDSYCDQFDIDRDLGGMVTGRIWGLACHAGLLAVAFTMHPKDMVEYRTAAEERTIITFTQLDQDRDLDLDQPADFSPEALRAKREAVLSYILRHEESLSKKVLYAAACCTILDSHNEDLLAKSRTVLERLASVTGADLSEEISKCTPGPDTGTIEPKSPSQLSAGNGIFEQCDICDAGIRWYSVTEAQCANGHLFVRCGLTVLAIQEPGISKFCAHCGTEYLGAEFVDVSRGTDLCTTYQKLCDVFDLCIYCGGKFQP